MKKVSIVTSNRSLVVICPQVSSVPDKSSSIINVSYTSSIMSIEVIVLTDTENRVIYRLDGPIVQTFAMVDMIPVIAKNVTCEELSLSPLALGNTREDRIFNLIMLGSSLWIGMLASMNDSYCSPLNLFYPLNPKTPVQYPVIDGLAINPELYRWMSYQMDLYMILREETVGYHWMVNSTYFWRILCPYCPIPQGAPQLVMAEGIHIAIVQFANILICYCTSCSDSRRESDQLIEKIRCDIIQLTNQSVERIESIACISEKAMLASAQLLISLIVTSFAEMDRRISYARSMVTTAISQEVKRIECVLQDIVRSTDNQVRGISNTIDLAKDQVSRFTQEVKVSIDLELMRLRHELDSITQKLPDPSTISSSEDIHRMIMDHEERVANTLMCMEQKITRECNMNVSRCDRDREIDELKDKVALLNRKIETLTRLISHNP